MAFDQYQFIEIVANDSDLKMRLGIGCHVVLMTFVGNFEMLDAELIV